LAFQNNLSPMILHGWHIRKNTLSTCAPADCFGPVFFSAASLQAPT
jgi:hypothetical protein